MSFFLLYAILPYVIYKMSSYVRIPNLLYVYLLILAIIRFDNVSDYSNYVEIFQGVSTGAVSDRMSAEIGYIALNKLFSFWDYGYIVVIGISTLSVYYAMYLYFKQYDVIGIAMLLFCAWGSYIIIDNIVRQNIAFAIINIVFFYYINKKMSIWIVVLAGLFAAIFHVSVLLVIPIYILFPHLKRKILSFGPVLVINMITYLLMSAGAFKRLFEMLFDNVIMNSAILYERYSGYGTLDPINIDFSIGGLFKEILCVLPVLLIDKVKDKNIIMFINITWLTRLVAMILYNVPFISRISDYFFIFQIIAIATFLMTYKNRYKVGDTNFGLYLRRLIILPLFYLSILGVNNYFGRESIYSTVFSYRCREFMFYTRLDYDDIMNGVAIYSTRNRYFRLNP